VWLERLRPEHAADFLEAASTSSGPIRRWLGEQAVPQHLDAAESLVAEWDEAWEAGARYGLLAREIDGNRVIGFGLLNAIHERYRIANLGYWVRQDALGRGYATAITRLVARFGFETLGMVRLELVIEPGNMASRRVAEKVGAVQEGLLRNRLIVNGAVRDALMYGLIPETLAENENLPS
jgi:RimJ/RimL family protein N-acetyltransferase